VLELFPDRPHKNGAHGAPPKFRGAQIPNPLL
jgi:hypothetical protein